jgi:hypothetical protein
MAARKNADDAAAGPNEAATGQESPADQAKTVNDPQASGDAATTAAEYGEDAPASLGPEQPQSAAEQAAHDATAATLEAAEASDVTTETSEERYTPEEALRVAADRARLLGRPTPAEGEQATESGDSNTDAK